jgi:hypothetical protein
MLGAGLVAKVAGAAAPVLAIAAAGAGALLVVGLAGATTVGTREEVSRADIKPSVSNGTPALSQPTVSEGVTDVSSSISCAGLNNSLSKLRPVSKSARATPLFPCALTFAASDSIIRLRTFK